MAGMKDFMADMPDEPTEDDVLIELLKRFIQSVRKKKKGGDDDKGTVVPSPG